ncbi:MAG: adenylosuccinate synthase [Kiritimatiellae bacterium]|nr:adenylosuccinate synthase [Kiritimatiellia bacterium]
MATVVIVGAQWGDEGKGKVVDNLAAQAEIVVRFQGGDNAGHTVYHAGQKHVFHILPSGILRKHVLNLIGGGVVVNLNKLAAEIDKVGIKPSELSGRLRISGEAHLILPCHIALDEKNEKRLGRGKIGTTLRGIGPAYADRAARTGVRFADIFDEKLLRARLAACFEAKRGLFSKREMRAVCNVNRAAEEIRVLAGRLKFLPGDTGLILEQGRKAGKNILFEGAQGTMLDIGAGTYPYVTSSHTVAGAAGVGAGVGPRFLDKIIGITKAYITRVGEGPFPTELDNELGEKLRADGGEYGATTGRPRRCGWLDLVLLRRAARLNSLDGLIVTKLDVLDSFDRIGLCTAYHCRGKRLAEWPENPADAAAVKPEYIFMPGWKQPTGRAGSFAALPAAARKYLKTIERETGVPVMMVSAGKEREALIVRKPAF